LGYNVYQQCSGFRFQQQNPTRCVGDAHEMEFITPVLGFSCNQINVQISVFGVY
jgi:hypothetical protein